MPRCGQTKVKFRERNIQVMEVADFDDSPLGATRRAVCILRSLSSGMCCLSLCVISNRGFEEPATPVVRVEKVFLQTSVTIY